VIAAALPRARPAASIDVPNTVRRRGWRYRELITSPADLRGWLDREQGRLTMPPALDQPLVSRFLAVRDPVLRVLRAAATNSPVPAAAGAQTMPPADAQARPASAAQTLPAADVDAVNQLAAAAPAIRLLGARPGRYRTQSVTAADPATRLCAELAAAAIDLLTGPDAAALALCDAPGCGQLYLRGRPNQQWCDPHCGTRARAQRHADRARSS